MGIEQLSGAFLGLAKLGFDRMETEQRHAAQVAAQSIQLGRDENGFLKALPPLYDPGTTYGDTFNEVALKSWAAASLTATRDVLGQKAIEHKDNPDLFQKFAQDWIRGQAERAPPEMRGAIAQDMASLASQHHLSLLSYNDKKFTEQRGASLDNELQMQLSDYEGAALNGREEDAVKARLEAESLIQGLEKNGNIAEAKAARLRMERFTKDLPLLAANRAAIDAAGNPSNPAVTDANGRIAVSIGFYESNGKDNAKNPNSSATGFGQFINSTWLAMMNKYEPKRIEGLSEQEVLDLRRDRALAQKMTGLLVQENRDYFLAHGIANPTDGQLYLAHFLGAKGATKVILGESGAKVSTLVSQRAINSNPFLAGMTVGELQDWATQKIAVGQKRAIAAGALGTPADTANQLAQRVSNGEFGHGPADAARLTAQLLGQAQFAQAGALATAAADKAAKERAEGIVKVQLDKLAADPLGNGLIDPKTGKPNYDAIDGLTAGWAKTLGVNQYELFGQLAGRVRSEAGEIQKRIETVNEIAGVVAGGGVPDWTGDKRKIMGQYAKQVYGHDLNAMNPDDHQPIQAMFGRYNMVPDYTVATLRGAAQITNEQDEGKIRNAVGLFDRLLQENPSKMGALQNALGPQTFEAMERLRDNMTGGRLTDINRIYAQVLANPQSVAAKNAAAWGISEKNPVGDTRQVANDFFKPSGMATIGQFVPFLHAGLDADDTLKRVLGNKLLSEAPNWSDREKAARAAWNQLEPHVALSRSGPDGELKWRYLAPEAVTDARYFTETAAKELAPVFDGMKQSSTMKAIGQVVGNAFGGAVSFSLMAGIVDGDGELTASDFGGPLGYAKHLAGKIQDPTIPIDSRDIRAWIKAGVINFTPDLVDVPKDAKGRPNPRYDVWVNNNGMMMPVGKFQMPNLDSPYAEEANAKALEVTKRLRDQGIDVPAGAVKAAQTVVGTVADIPGDVGLWFRDTVWRGMKNFGTGTAQGFSPKPREATDFVQPAGAPPVQTPFGAPKEAPGKPLAANVNTIADPWE